MPDQWVTADQIKPVGSGADRWVTADELHTVEEPAPPPVEASALSRFGTGVARNFNPIDLIKNTVGAVMDPYGVLTRERDRYEALHKQELHNPQEWQKWLLEHIPLVGPQLSHAAGEFNNNNYAGGAGEIVGGVGTSMLPLPKVVKGVDEVLPGAVKGMARGAGTSIENIGKIPLDKAMGLSGGAMGMGAGLAHYAANPELLTGGVAAGTGILAARTQLAQALASKLKGWGGVVKPAEEVRSATGSAPRPPLGPARDWFPAAAKGSAPIPPLRINESPVRSATPVPPLAPLPNHAQTPTAPIPNLGPARDWFPETPRTSAPIPPLGPARSWDPPRPMPSEPSPTLASTLAEQLQASLKAQGEKPSSITPAAKLGVKDTTSRENIVPGTGPGTGQPRMTYADLAAAVAVDEAQTAINAGRQSRAATHKANAISDKKYTQSKDEE